MKTGYKIILLLVIIALTAVLGALPFFAAKTNRIAIYTKDTTPDSREQGFMRELKLLGYGVILNPETPLSPETPVIWFGRPELAIEIDTFPASHKFLYTEDYYPFNWQGLKNPPVILTPHRLLFEHYSRANIKSALFFLGVNTADYSPSSTKFKYPVIYYEDNKNYSPVADIIATLDNAKFLGSFWPKRENVITLPEENAKARANILSQSGIVVVNVDQNSAASQYIPLKAIEASAAGALVVMPFLPAAKEVYGDNFIFYHTPNEVKHLITTFLNNKKQREEKITAASKITIEKLSSAASAHRFQELLEWLKQN